MKQWKLCIVFFSFSEENANGRFHDDCLQMGTFSAWLAFWVGIHRSPVNSQHKGQWRGALMFSLICACHRAWTNDWVSNRETGNLIHHRAHYDVIVIYCFASYIVHDWDNHIWLTAIRTVIWLNGVLLSINVIKYFWYFHARKIKLFSVLMLQPS